MRTLTRAALAMALAPSLLAPSSANAVELSDASGQVLLFPYYTVNAGLSTLFQISNGSTSPKALRVRFREGSNGREALAFNLYLGAHSTWAAAITGEAMGFPRLLTQGDACTVPSIAATGQRFLGFEYPENAPGGGTTVEGRPERAREGMFEVIEMGEVEGGFAASVSGRDCAALAAAFDMPSGGAWHVEPNRDIRPPGGGLTGSAALVNVEQGVMYSFRAIAIDRFSGLAQHASPGELVPHLGTAAADDPIAPVQARWRDADGTPRLAHWPRERAIDAVSAVLTQTEVRNSFAVDPALGASTEWVLTFPTRHFYADNSPGGLVNGPALAPFTPVASLEVPLAGGARRPVPEALCVAHRLDVWSRAGEDMRPPASACFGGQYCGPYQAFTCHVTQALVMGEPASFTQVSAVLGSQRQVPSSYSDALNVLGPFSRITAPSGAAGTGQARLRLAGRLRPSLEGIVPQGLPVIAISLERYTNTQVLPGVLANYATALPHVGRVETVDAQD